MQGDFSKNTKEYNFMADFYKYCQKHYIVENTQSYWDEVIKAGEELAKKYDNMALATNLVVGFISYAESQK